MTASGDPGLVHRGWASLAVLHHLSASKHCSPYVQLRFFSCVEMREEMKMCHFKSFGMKQAGESRKVCPKLAKIS